MFCTDEERDTCQCEKMGCEGCFYNNEKYNKKPFYKRIAEKFSKKGLEFAFKLPKPRLCISVKDIKIKDEFIKRPPSKKKMSQKWRYYREKMIYLIIILLGFVFGMLFGFCAGMLAGVFIGEEKHVRKH